MKTWILHAWKSKTIRINGLVVLGVIAAKVAASFGYELDPVAVSLMLSALGLDVPLTGASLDAILNASLVFALGNMGLRFTTTKPLSER